MQHHQEEPLSTLTALRASIIGAAIAAVIVAAGASPAAAEVDEVVRFSPGTNHAVRKNSVAGAERHSYHFEAAAGQRFNVVTHSIENNSRVDIYRPDGALMSTDTASAEIELPETGRYTVKVGSARGNATYELTVTIN